MSVVGVAEAVVLDQAVGDIGDVAGREVGGGAVALGIVGVGFGRCRRPAGRQAPGMSSALDTVDHQSQGSTQSG